MRDEKRVRTKNGRRGISGICTVRGGKMFKMVGSAAKTRSKVSSKKQIRKRGIVKGKAKIKRKM